MWQALSYRYKLYQDNSEKTDTRYTLDELMDMGTFMLRDICVREKIMTKSAGIDAKRLKREELIELLFRYRGKQKESLAGEFSKEAAELLKIMSEKAAIAPEKLEIPYKIELKKDIPLLEEEDVRVHHGFAGEHFLGVLSADGEILAVFEIRDDRMSLSDSHISPSLAVGQYRDLQVVLFDQDSSLSVIQAYNDRKWDMSKGRGLTAAKAGLPILSMIKAEDSEVPLVIDFGAGNTSAAAAGQSGIRHVSFRGGSSLCPTVAAVKRCTEGAVRFCFGYEALDLVRRDGYGREISFFHNLKRFLYREIMLDVCDSEGNAASVSSDTLLEQFFRYIICLANGGHGKNYTKICFLLPEKRKRLALARLRTLLPDYQVDEALSESVNSIYQKIIEDIAEGEEHTSLRAGSGGWKEEAPVKELAFHCGAGQSSLVACEYEVLDSGVAYQVSLKEQYLDGDNGFGGNSLTCLIFMYLKIKVMCEIKGISREVLGEAFQDAYSYVDRYGGTSEIYKEFYKLYQEAEQVVPTRFADFEKDRLLKRQNFFRLWFLAEGLKTAFFIGTPISMLQLPHKFREFCGMNAVFPEGIREYNLEFAVHKAELELVMAPDIYRIVKRFIEPLCGEFGILMGYKIKFTGLSCYIPVFRDAFREFTVGRRSRTGSGRDEGLKLRALWGAVRREQMKKSGRIIPEMIELEAEISCIVTVQSHDGKLVQIISGNHAGLKVFGYVKRHVATREVVFTICDVFGNAMRSRKVCLDIRDFKETGYDELFEAYPLFRGIQGDFDSIGEEEIRLFVFKEEDWDFCVLPAVRRDGVLKVDLAKQFLFDDESADYFCGIY